MRSFAATRSRAALLVCSGAWVLASCSSPAAAPAAAARRPAHRRRRQADDRGRGSDGTRGSRCDDGARRGSGSDGTPIKVGVMDDVTGVGAIEGALMRVSTDLVVQRTNSSGGINGHPLQVTYVDPKGDATQALNLATQLAQQDNVDVLAGGLFSPECLGVSGLAAKLQMVYISTNGCASDVLTSKQCDKYTFRVYPVGRQTGDPTVKFEVTTFGPKWGIIYPDYALGQSTLATTQAALQANGADLPVQIAVPLGEANVTPYVTKVPTDGSIQVLQVSETGSDLARVMSVIQQFGINSKVAIVTALGKESFAGVYPDALNGAIITGTRPSDGIPGNADDAKYMQEWLAIAKGPMPTSSGRWAASTMSRQATTTATTPTCR